MDDDADYGECEMCLKDKEIYDGCCLDCLKEHYTDDMLAMLPENTR
jgi:hypothetical protein